MYAVNGLGSVVTQVVANADAGGYDGQVCFTCWRLRVLIWFHSFSVKISFLLVRSPQPHHWTSLDGSRVQSLTRYRLVRNRVARGWKCCISVISTLIQVRQVCISMIMTYCFWNEGYATGSEGNCTSGLCCRDNNPNKAFPNAPSLPAPRFGTFLWCIHQQSTINFPDRYNLAIRPMLWDSPH